MREDLDDCQSDSADAPDVIVSGHTPLPTAASELALGLGPWELGNWEWLGVGSRQLGVDRYQSTCTVNCMALGWTTKE
jgi:hypothetical protein